MSKFIKAALASSVLAASVMGAGAANAATATADAKANILAEVTLTHDNTVSSLDFGTIVADADGGTVVVSTAGARSSCTGVVCSGDTDAADFVLGGTANETVNLVVPTAPISISNGTESMDVTLDSSVAGGSVSLGASGSVPISVGGSLAVGANQADGAYTGTFTLTADYN